MLISLRDFQDSKADVILKYNADEARQLKAYGELPENCKINESAVDAEGEDDDIPYEFDEVGKYLYIIIPFPIRMRIEEPLNFVSLFIHLDLQCNHVIPSI